jgi:hypothetical protein
MRAAAWRRGTVSVDTETRVLLEPRHGTRAAIWGLDSIGLVDATDADTVIVIGSHGALHGGDPASALPVAARGVFFHDAGRGKEDAGVSRLPALDARAVGLSAAGRKQVAGIGSPCVDSRITPR